MTTAAPETVIARGPARLAPMSGMRFTLRQLEYFVAAAEAGSITEAALNIPVAQSSVSAAIAQLETGLGVQLFIRHHAQGITPTAEGRQFAVKARSLLREADELERFASELTAELSGTLNLGCLVTLAPLIAPHLGKGFRDRHAAVVLEMVEAGQDEIMAGLRSGKLSVALTYDLELTTDITFTPLATLPPFAVLSAEHPLAGKAVLTLDELAKEPLVLLDLSMSRDYFTGLFRAIGAEPSIAHRSMHPEVIRTMVANDFGYTIVNIRPTVSMALDGRPLVTRPIAGSPRPMIMGLARLKELRPTRLVEAFEQHCRAAIAEKTMPGLSDDS